MKILVATNYLDVTGGSENFSYALIGELVKRGGYDVEYYCDPEFRGGISKRIEFDFGVRFKTQQSYDLIFANHTTMVRKLHSYGYVIQTCHGIYPELEQPSPYAAAHVVISQEIKDYVGSLDFESHLILNGIDCDVFRPYTPINSELKCVLSLCQGEEANGYVKEACARLGVEFLQATKWKENVFHIEKVINRADLVVGVGRSLYDAMACGRACFSLDSRGYSATKDGCSVVGDGYLTANNVDESILHNCTGRGSGRAFLGVEDVIAELKRYDSSDGEAMRNYALESLNMARNVDRYLQIYRDDIDVEYEADGCCLRRELMP